jgi:methionine synthase II (cobalamin-independent)
MGSYEEWSRAEKKIARRAFDAALEKVLSAAVADFKARAAAVTTPSEMWAIGDDLQRQSREIDQMFDYRYSQLTWVFAVLIHSGLMEETALTGLADAKLADIHHTLSFLKRRDGTD